MKKFWREAALVALAATGSYCNTLWLWRLSRRRARIERMKMNTNQLNLNRLSALILLLFSASACNILAQPPSASTPTTITIQPTNTALPESPTGNATGSNFGPITGPNFTPPPTFTQSPAVTPTQVPPTAAPGNGPTSDFGSILQANSTVPPAPTQAVAVPSTPIPPTQSSAPGPTSNFGAIVGPNDTPPPTFTIGPPPTVNPTNVTLPPAVTSGPSPTPGPGLRSDLMGVQIHAFLTNPQWNQMLAFVQQLGISWIKAQVDWSSMERTKGQFSEQYSTLVQNIQRASAGKFHTMVSIAKAPNWARPASARRQQDGPSDNPQDFADFVAQFIRDTKPVNIDAIEIWNEPNLIREWDGKPINGAEYMKYFNAVYPAIINEEKAQPDQFRPNHRITILTSGPAPTGTTDVTLNDRVWLQQLYDNGLAKYGDDVAVGAHPYGWANSPDALCCNAQPGITGWYADPSFYFRNTIDDYRQIIKKNDPNRKMWVTQFGLASSDRLRTRSG